jgi:hypothetical protein
MANTLTSNPLYVDTAATILAGPAVSKIIEIDWIDDNADINNDSDLSITFNDVTFTVKPQRHETATNVDWGGTLFKLGPFNPGIPCSRLVVNTIDAGVLLIWRG